RERIHIPLSLEPRLRPVCSSDPAPLEGSPVPLNSLSCVEASTLDFKLEFFRVMFLQIGGNARLAHEAATKLVGSILAYFGVAFDAEELQRDRRTHGRR